MSIGAQNMPRGHLHYVQRFAHKLRCDERLQLKPYCGTLPALRIQGGEAGGGVNGEGGGGSGGDTGGELGGDGGLGGAAGGEG